MAIAGIWDITDIDPIRLRRLVLEFGAQADEGSATPGSVLIYRFVPLICGIVDAGIKLELISHRIRGAQVEQRVTTQAYGRGWIDIEVLIQTVPSEPRGDRSLHAVRP